MANFTTENTASTEFVFDFRPLVSSVFSVANFAARNINSPPRTCIQCYSAGAVGLARKGEALLPSTTAKVTTDHDEIRRWAEQRGAKPATVLRPGNDGEPGSVRLDFPGDGAPGSLEEMSWDGWFKKFDQSSLALLYQEQTAGGERSDFYEIITRETAEEAAIAVGGKGRSAAHKRARKSVPSASGSRANSSGTSVRPEDRGETTKQSTSARERASSSGRVPRGLKRARKEKRRPGGAAKPAPLRSNRRNEVIRDADAIAQ